jgi:hypothetical protein
MKGNSLVSTIAVVFIIGAIVILLKNVIPEMGDMGEDGWLIVLIILGVLFGIVALIVKGNSNNEEENNTTASIEQDGIIRTLKKLRENGVLTDEEYLAKVNAHNDEIAKVKWENGEFFDMLVSIYNAREANFITQEEFLAKSKNIVKNDVRIMSDKQLDKWNNLYIDKIISEKEYNSGMVRRYLFLSCFDDNTISALLNNEIPIITKPQIKYLSYYKFLTNLDKFYLEELLIYYQNRKITKDLYIKKIKGIVKSPSFFKNIISSEMNNF